ncbi:unnamed protein product [Closterium sp. NIES-53]
MATEPPQVVTFAWVSASGQVAASCSCPLLSHETLLWHHHLGHPSLPRLRGMHSGLLVSGLPRSLPPLPPLPGPPCLPCVEVRQRAAPHSSCFPPMTAPLQTLHMDVWGPGCVSGRGCERYFLLVVDDYTRYTTVFPLGSKGEVSYVLIPWIRTVRLQLRERFGQDLPVLRLHSDRGGEFSSDLLRDFCRGEGILQSFTLPDSPQQNGIAERRIGLVMKPRVSLLETSPTLHWMGNVGDASVFRFYHPTSCRVLPSQDVTFDESVPFYRLFPYRSAPPPPPPLFLAPGPPPVDPGAGCAGDTVRSRPYFVPLLQQVLGVPSSTGLLPPFQCPSPDQSQPPLQPDSPLPAPSPYTVQFGGLTERREPASRPLSPVRTARRAPRSCPPLVSGTHIMALRPSSVPLRVSLPAPPESSLPEVPDPMSDRARAACPTVARLLATAVTDPSFESAAASALVAKLLDIAAACRLDYASALVPESLHAIPPSVGGESALGTDVLEDWQEDFECLAAAVPRFASMLLAPEGDPDAPDIPTPHSYAEAITGPYSSLWQAAMDAEMASWKSTGTYVDAVPMCRANIVDGMWIFRGVDYFQPFSPTSKMTTLRVLLHVAAQRDYELHSLDFSTALRRPVYSLCQAPREWHDTLKTTFAALGFAPSTADPSLFLRTDTLLLPFYVLVYVDDVIFATADTEALTLVKSELQKRHTCTDLGELRSYLGLQITRNRARRTITLTQSHMVHQVLQRFGFQFSSPQPTTLSTSHLLSAPPSDESHGHLRLAYVATRAKTADVFTKALPPGDHQRFTTMLACFAFLDWSCDHLFSPTLPMGVCQTYMLHIV